jgi:ankyrin repeat protein
MKPDVKHKYRTGSGKDRVRLRQDKTPGQQVTGRATVICICVLLGLPGFVGCVQSRSDKPTPDAAKRFLKLRGYEFNDKSFLRAAAANDVIAVNGFLAAGINPNVKDESSGATALISAASHDSPEIVSALLRAGADANVKDNAGYMAILRAIQNKHDEIADLLLAQTNLDVNSRGAIGSTVLMSYVWREQADVVRNLLERGANPNLSDEDGDRALHGAAMRGNVDILRMLLAKGADPNAKNKVGGTALMWAGTYGHDEVARVLIEAGADPTLKDHNGMTASAWAAKNKRDDIAHLLSDAEKKR